MGICEAWYCQPWALMGTERPTSGTQLALPIILAAAIFRILRCQAWRRSGHEVGGGRAGHQNGPVPLRKTIEPSILGNVAQYVLGHWRYALDTAAFMGLQFTIIPIGFEEL
ncbi:hypothetical protein EJ08DRAFT_96275 [Tothia fuscella]|uniref:Uncharacterized protein n=1 Tax=Tothia fuscella TaxID=1048955 RepID=A0A9P4NVU5_9PEZI|nr:hypothetical protein EJ08DRAFT_96275 [Tothia fuscella]